MDDVRRLESNGGGALQREMQLVGGDDGLAPGAFEIAQLPPPHVPHHLDDGARGILAME
jgi:hypothetical protein